MMFKFKGLLKPVIKKKHNKQNASKIIKAIVALNDLNECVAKIELNNNYEIGDIEEIPFTENSLSLKGKEIIYSKDKCDHKHYLKVIRDPIKALHFPGYNNNFIPFKIGSAVEGYIKIIEDKKYFEVKKVLE